MRRVHDRAGVAEPARWCAASVMVAVLSAAALAVLPVAGALCGAWVAWAPPSGVACGLWVFPVLFLAECGGLLGLAVGVGLVG
jgi:hypothetical protein